MTGIPPAEAAAPPGRIGARTQQMKYFPSSVTFTDGAIATDGGSIGLSGFDDLGEEVHLMLDQSFAARETGTVQLRINGSAVRSGSAEENAWLNLIRDAGVTAQGVDPDDRASYEQDVRWLRDELIAAMKPVL